VIHLPAKGHLRHTLWPRNLHLDLGVEVENSVAAVFGAPDAFVVQATQVKAH